MTHITGQVTKRLQNGNTDNRRCICAFVLLNIVVIMIFHHLPVVLLFYPAEVHGVFDPGVRADPVF